MTARPWRRRRDHRHVLHVPGRAERRRVLAEHPRQGRRGHGPAAGGVGRRRLLRPGLRRHRQGLRQARRLPGRAGVVRSARLRHPARLGRAASPTSGSRSSSPTTPSTMRAAPTCRPRSAPGRGSCSARARTSTAATRIVVQRGLVVEPDARRRCKQLQPEYTDRQIELLRDELKACAAADRPGDGAGAHPEHHRRADREPARPHGPELHGRRRVRVVARRGPARHARPARPGRATWPSPAARRSGCPCRRSTSSASSARSRAASASGRSTRTPTARCWARASAWSCSSARRTRCGTAIASTRWSGASASRATDAASA